MGAKTWQKVTMVTINVPTFSFSFFSKNNSMVCVKVLLFYEKELGIKAGTNIVTIVTIVTGKKIQLRFSVHLR